VLSGFWATQNIIFLAQTCLASLAPASAPPDPKRARAPALDAAVSTLEVPGLGQPYGLLVLADGTRLVGNEQNTLQLLTPAP
jgi:hypothetical protein